MSRKIKELQHPSVYLLVTNARAPYLRSHHYSTAMHTLKRYTDLYASGAMDERIDSLDTLAASCSLCPRACGVNRTKGERGTCRAPYELTVCKFLPHFGEEPVLTGTNGSGTIFFTYCHLNCQFCQNYQISQEHLGTLLKPPELADIMLRLQQQGCHNINLVSPTHFLPQIMKAVKAAAARGLTLPLVYNTNGYERVEVLALLDGIIDVYLPDAKYGDDRVSAGLLPCTALYFLQSVFPQGNVPTGWTAHDGPGRGSPARNNHSPPRSST